MIDARKNSIRKLRSLERNDWQVRQPNYEKNSTRQRRPSHLLRRSHFCLSGLCPQFLWFRLSLPSSFRKRRRGAPYHHGGEGPRSSQTAEQVTQNRITACTTTASADTTPRPHLSARIRDSQRGPWLHYELLLQSFFKTGRTEDEGNNRMTVTRFRDQSRDRCFVLGWWERERERDSRVFFIDLFLVKNFMY